MVRSWAGIIRDDSEAAATEDVHLNKPFPDQLTSYYAKYRSDDIDIIAFNRFVGATNQALKDMHLEEKITPLQIKELLSGHKGPTLPLVRAFAQVFNSAKIGFYGDERQSFVTAGESAAKAEEARIANEGARCQPLRSTNPPGKEGKPSFQEMIEETYRQNGSFSTLIFSKTLPVWEINKQQFCDHLEALNKDREGKKTFVPDTLCKWGKDNNALFRESIAVLCDAFSIKPAKGEKMAPHEAMLWCITGNHTFTWKKKKDTEALEQALADCKASKNSGPLVTELCETSGVPFNHMQELLGTKQLAEWKNGSGHIDDINRAVEFVNMVNPCLGIKDEARKRYNADIFSIVTGRPNDIEAILKESLTQGNPSGALFSALTGRGGMMTVTADDLVAAMHAAGIADYSKYTVSRQRNTLKRANGGDIHEAHAKVILDTFEARIKPMAEKGMYKALTPEQREKCIDMLTNCAPKKMLAQCVAGKMNIRTLIKHAYERKGLHQQGSGSFTEQSGIWNVSQFLKEEGRHMTHEVAGRLADWFATHYKFDKHERRQVMALAEGVDLRESPDAILAKVVAGTMERPAALQLLYDQTGLTREGLADAANVPVSLIRYSVTQVSAGRLASDEIDDNTLAKHVLAIAREIGIAKKDRAQFAEQFSTVARAVALQDLVANTEQTNANGKA